MNSELKKNYEDWTNYISNILKSDKSWVDQYKEYAIYLTKNRKGFKDARRRFHEVAPFHFYLSIGRVKGSKKVFDIRYLGQSVGMIIANNDNVKLVVNETQSINSEKYFGYDLGVIEGVDWSSSKVAKNFRSFYKGDCVGLPRQKEHMVESALFSETGKTSSKTKSLCNIQPVSYAGTRIHMKTAVKASEAGKEIAEVSSSGGEIDLLCRRSIKRGRGESRLVVIEIKDENKKKESFDTTMKQAISYGVFLRELIHSEAGGLWMDLWGMGNQKKEGFIIDCVVAMPRGETSPGYNGDKITIYDNESAPDYLELHYMELTSIKADDVVFESSMQA